MYSARVEHAFTLPHLALILFLAFVGGLFLQRLRQPTLVGYIIVGMIIGPGLLGLQGNDPLVQELAELAVILLMFMLGLELDIKQFKRSMRPALITAGLQIVIGLVFMLGFGYFLGWSWQLGILLGFAISLSSTAVAMSMLWELRANQSSAGRLATAILIAQDLAVIPMLLVVATLGGDSIGVVDVVRLVFALAVIAGSIFIVGYIQRHPDLLRRAERVLGIGQAQPVIAGMALCFGAAAVSGALGLSAAYGAFAMGLLLGNVGALGAAYRNAIHSIHDLLIMVFFLSIGLMLNLAFILKNVVVISIVLGTVLVMKTVINTAILRALNVPFKSALVLSAVLGQIGEFSFVLITLGAANGFIKNDDYQMALAVIALSLTFSPLWLTLVRRYVRTS